MRRGLKVEWVLFDNWYASEDNLSLLARLSLHWVTRAKRNLKVEYGGQNQSVSQLAASIKKANYHYYSGLALRAQSFEVRRGGKVLKLVVIKDDRSPEKGHTKYLLSDKTSLTTRELIEWYRKRWAIEVFFRDCKQLLGMGECEARRQEAILSHILLVCVAYTLLQMMRPASGKQRRSVCGIKDEMAALVMLPIKRSGLQAHRQMPSGDLKKVDEEHFLDPIRTRLRQLTIPKLLTFS